MIYLTYTGWTRPTGRRIAQEMGLTNHGRSANVSPEILIRWGSRVRVGSPPLVLNKSSAIKRARDKVCTLQLLAEQGIPHVPFFLTWEEALTAGGDGFILGRTRSGMQGSGIYVYDPSQILGGEYAAEPYFQHEWYSLYQKPTREVRLHVVGNEVVRVQGKYLDVPGDMRNAFVRNYANGYRFRAPREDVLFPRKEAAIEAVKALGLDFGAVDMLLMGNHLDAPILEINTAPACSPLTVSAYARALERKLSE